MRPVNAVVTTGIYCTPGCGGRPNPGNVRSFDLAAAAEAAGFRACLRCRPYRSSEPIRVNGPEVVCRAVQLIVRGALDEHDEAQLAARLHLSARHLRRLFVEHAGVTPDQLARSSRAHFARRLLDDTDLSVTDIAFAAGFGSLRQFNRAMTTTFRAAPSELRARRRTSDRLVADGGLPIRLGFVPPLEWHSMLRYLAARAIAGVEHVSDDVYRRTIVSGGDVGVLEITRAADDHLVLRAHLPHWERLIHVVARARRIFNLDLDVLAANRALARDRVVGALVGLRPGLRIPGAWDAFEIGVRAIVGQQVSVAGAGTITRRLVERLGTPVAGLGPLGLSHLFPSAATLAGADLSGIGLTTSRAATIQRFAEAVARGDLALDGAAGLDDLVAALVRVAGIGE